MLKAKINFEVDAQNLANAQAFAALHRVSLNKLVSAYFGSLGQAEGSGLGPLDAAQKLLLQVALGKLSLVDAAQALNLPDAGYVLHMMRDAKLPLPSLPKEQVQQQMDTAREALKECLLPGALPPNPPPARRKSRAKAVTAG